MPLSNDNSRVDFLGNPAVQDHLTNWGPWTWVLMIGLAVFLLVGSVLLSCFAPKYESTGTIAAMNSPMMLYCLWPLLLIVRHLPHSGAIWLMIGSLAIFAVGFVVRSRIVQDVSWTSVFAVILFHGGIYTYDRFARHVADLPLAWVTLLFIIGGGILLFLWPKKR
ncbi:hypothetical protein [Kocuria palustris]|uniref:hypothetical protein n=1 Tax=Kocuria palustris TaxID=71999 RepID=UPI0024328C09|nr:hypothetical protein [Kocuria palustris]